MLTRSIKVDGTIAPEVRQALRSRVRLQFTERRHWLLWRVFTVTGPAEQIGAVEQEIEMLKVAAWWENQW